MMLVTKTILAAVIAALVPAATGAAKPPPYGWIRPDCDGVRYSLTFHGPGPHVAHATITLDHDPAITRTIRWNGGHVTARLPITIAQDGEPHDIVATLTWPEGEDHQTVTLACGPLPDPTPTPTPATPPAIAPPPAARIAPPPTPTPTLRPACPPFTGKLAVVTAPRRAPAVGHLTIRVRGANLTHVTATVGASNARRKVTLKRTRRHGWTRTLNAATYRGRAKRTVKVEVIATHGTRPCATTLTLVTTRKLESPEPPHVPR